MAKQFHTYLKDALRTGLFLKNKLGDEKDLLDLMYKYGEDATGSPFVDLGREVYKTVRDWDKECDTCKHKLYLLLRTSVIRKLVELHLEYEKDAKLYDLMTCLNGQGAPLATYHNIGVSARSCTREWINQQSKVS